MGFDMLRGGHTVGQAPPADDDAESACSAHHVCRRTGDDHGHCDLGGRAHSGRSPGDRHCRRGGRRGGHVLGFCFS